jgi:hypothetical protein
MRQNDTPANIIRAREVQLILNCSKQYAYDVLNSLPKISLATTAKQPPRGCLRTDFEKWLLDLQTSIAARSDVEGGKDA